MQGGNRQLKVVWRREWDYQKRGLLIQWAVGVSLLLLLFLIYSLKESWLFNGLSYVKALPPALYAFVGFTEETLPSGSLFTFIELFVMCLHVWLAWSFGARGMQSIWREEEDNHIYLIANQWCGRYELAIYKFTWSAVSMLATYVALFLPGVVLLLAGSASRVLLLENVMAMLGWMIRGCFVLLLLLTVCVSYALCCGYREQTYWAGGVVFGTLIIGNLYKIRDLACWILERLQINGELFNRLLGWLDGLYWISPLSWLNPFREAGALQITGQTVLCIIIAGIFGLAGIFRYRTRELGW
ncbi:MAG: hypothetical protein NC081_02725 [Roseburia sp.]|nr:hypothetical protein [Roseburia sp.]